MGAGASRKPKVYLAQNAGASGRKVVQKSVPAKSDVPEIPESSVPELATPRMEDFRLAPFLQDVGPRPCLNTEGKEQPPRVGSYRSRAGAGETVAVPTRVPMPEGPRPPQAPPAPAPPGAPARPSIPLRKQKQVQQSALPGPPIGGAGRRRRDRPSAVQLMVESYWRDEEMETATPSTCESDGLAATITSQSSCRSGNCGCEPQLASLSRQRQGGCEPRRLPFLADEDSDRDVD